MAVYINRSETFRTEGVSVLRANFRIPKTGLNDKIDELYEKIAQNALNWVRNSLFATVSGDFLSDPNPKKRFYYGYIYTLDCNVVYCDSGILSVISTVTLKEKRSVTVTLSRKTAQVFRISDGALLPLRAVSTRALRKAYRRARGVGYYVGTSGLSVLTADGTESPVFTVNNN